MTKVLIVEDDKFIANAYRLKLGKAGYETKIAFDGQEASEAIKSGFKPDVILLDLILPIKDGFTFLTELRADPQNKSIVVLITSNLGQKEDIDRGMSLGANGYIIKTDLSMNDLIDKINGALEKKG